jgi:hypothetical protein
MIDERTVVTFARAGERGNPARSDGLESYARGDFDLRRCEDTIRDDVGWNQIARCFPGTHSRLNASTAKTFDEERPRQNGASVKQKHPVAGFRCRPI